MTLALYLAFVAASVVLIATPGPNVALIVGTSLGSGLRAGLWTVAGTTAASALLLALTVAGLGAAFEGLAHAFEIVRWLGAAYLLYLGARMLLARPGASVPRQAPRSGRTAFARGLAVSLANPKTLLFYGAFLPQFVAHDAPALPQLALLAATFVALAGILDALWVLGAHAVRGRGLLEARWPARLGGVALVAAAVGLALKRA
ncbi:MAG: LysE family translocator [Alphaproteobacteria bacterium]|nr:LysE family translocator [Alphaproteobacteria bacterium]